MATGSPPAFLALLTLTIALGAQDSPTPPSLEFTLRSDTTLHAGPREVEIEVERSPRTSPTLAQFEDGTPVRVDTVGRADGAKTTRLRLRWIDAHTWSTDPRRIALRYVDTPESRGDFELLAAPDGPTLRLRERAVWRLQSHYDPKNFDATFKPYHDLFDPLGTTQITKGLGGTYPHHRGLFVGWNKTVVDGKSLDFWHCHDGRHQVRVDGSTSLFLVVADSTDIVEWRDADEHPVVRETRKLSVWVAGDEQRIIDVDVELEALGKTPIRLDGDPQHAGCQVRLAEEVTAHEQDTRYQRTAGAHDQGNDVWSDCTWACIHAKVGDVAVIVLHASHPSNPAPFVYSTRAYGRLGSFQKFTLEPRQPVRLRYRLVIATEQHPGACADPAAAYGDFAAGLHVQANTIKNSSR